MKTNKKEITLIERKKAELQKQLNAIKETESVERTRKIDELIKIVKPEMDAFLSLTKFHTNGKIQVELTYDIALQLYVNQWRSLSATRHNYGNDIEFDGNCYINKTKEPKGYNISQFISEDCFSNIGIDEPQDLVTIHPEIKRHFEKYKKAKTALRNKIIKVAEKLNIDQQDALEAIDEHIS